MSRPTPTKVHAEGMLASIQRSHVCGEACASTTTLGDGTTLGLKCPYSLLDTDSQVDRRIIASLYADAALSAMGRR